jgi:signal peptidase II
VFALDRASKVWVVETLGLRERHFIPVLDPWLNFSMAWNRGINFGLFDLGGAGRWLYVALALAIVAALLAWLARGGGWARTLGVGAIAGGALGNVWDRVQYGAVADFLNMSCCGIDNPFAFNLADAAIFGGALLLVAAPREPEGEVTGGADCARDGAEDGR